MVDSRQFRGGRNMSKAFKIGYLDARGLNEPREDDLGGMEEYQRGYKEGSRKTVASSDSSDGCEADPPEGAAAAIEESVGFEEIYLGRKLTIREIIEMAVCRLRGSRDLRDPRKR